MAGARLLAAGVVLQALVGCLNPRSQGTDSGAPPGEGPAGSDAGPPTPDAGPARLPDGGHLRISVTHHPAGLIQAQVAAHGAGPVLGLSFHVTYDQTAMEVVDAAEPPPPTTYLDQDLSSPAWYLHRVRAGDVALGGSRRHRSDGDVTVADGTAVSTVWFKALRDGVTDLRVEQVVVRRSDGGYAPVVGMAHPVALRVTP